MNKMKHFLLPEQTNKLYSKEASSSLALTKDVANKINELVDAYNKLSAENLLWRHEQEGRIEKGVLFMKDNLLNSLHDLLMLFKSSGELDGIFADIIHGDLARVTETLETVTSVTVCGAIGNGVHDDSEAFMEAISKYKTVIIPNGTYVIRKELLCEGVNLIGGSASYLKFTKEAGHGLVFKNGVLKDINLIMSGEFDGDLLRVETDNTSYPDNTKVHNIGMFSLNTTNVGTFLHVKPSGTYAGIIENIRIGRSTDVVPSGKNKAEYGLRVTVENGSWATGFLFRDIVVDGYILKPLTVTSPDYYSFMDAMFNNIQIQIRNNSDGFVHEYGAKFEGVQDLYVTNCKLWDYNSEYCRKRVEYRNCTNVVIRKSPIFDKYFDDVDVFVNDAGKLGLKENMKLHHTGLSKDNGFVGTSVEVPVSGSNTQAIPFLFPHNYSDVLYSRMSLEIFTRLDYSAGSGDTYLRFECAPTNFMKNNTYMNNVQGSHVVKKIKKYSEGVVVWIKGGIGKFCTNYVCGGIVKEVAGNTLTLSAGGSETVSIEAWNDTSIPVSKNMVIVYGDTIESTTVV